jgi:hypothetical protein
MSSNRKIVAPGEHVVSGPRSTEMRSILLLADLSPN